MMATTANTPALSEAQQKAFNDALIDAAKNGKLDVVKVMFQLGANIDAKDSNRWTALMWASQNGRKEIIELLLAGSYGPDGKVSNVDVNAKDSDGWTALMIASSNGYKEIVELLLAHKADVNAKDSDGWTALGVASGNGYKEIVKILEDAKTKLEPKAGPTAYTIRVPPGVSPKIVFDATATEITITSD